MPPPVRRRPCLQKDCRSAACAAYLTALAQHEATMGKDGPDRSRCRMDDRHVWMEEGPRQRSRPPPADGGLAAQERKEHRETTWPADRGSTVETRARDEPSVNLRRQDLLALEASLGGTAHNRPQLPTSVEAGKKLTKNAPSPFFSHPRTRPRPFATSVSRDRERAAQGMAESTCCKRSTWSVKILSPLRAHAKIYRKRKALTLRRPSIAAGWATSAERV